MQLSDALRRPLRDLRISVTDRCNFRCQYCMPKEVYGRDYPFVPRSALLTFEELERLAALFVSCGVEKIRITGGEPLLRHDITSLVRALSSIDGLHDLAMTTNGSLLTTDVARSLRAAGLQRISVSLDAVDDVTFRKMNDVDFGVARVLAAIDAAGEAGLFPVKIDVVLRRGVNDEQIVPIARRFRGTPHIVRFIEFMDVGTTNGWRRDDVVPGSEVVATIAREWPLEQVAPNSFGEVAERWRYVDGGGEIGVITSVSQPFCGTCTRVRLSSEGRLYTCLFASQGVDLRGPLRSGATDDELLQIIGATWRARGDRYSELRAESAGLEPRVEMPHIGG